MALCTINYNSYVLRMDVSVNVLLPEQRHRPHEKLRHGYPVLYLLHGFGDDQTAWLRKSTLELRARELELVVVMPMGMNGFYTDQEQGWDYFSSVAHELPQVISNYFPISTARSDTFVAGVSMGGYGALKLAFTYPNRYAAAASLSGALQPYEISRRMSDPLFRGAIDRSFGGEERFAGSENDLLHLARRIEGSAGPTPRIFMDCGRQDELCYDSNVAFRDALEMDCPHLDLRYSEGDGAHTWDYWSACVPEMLEHFRLVPARAGSASLNT